MGFRNLHLNTFAKKLFYFRIIFIEIPLVGGRRKNQTQAKTCNIFCRMDSRILGFANSLAQELTAALSSEGIARMKDTVFVLLNKIPDPLTSGLILYFLMQKSCHARLFGGYLPGRG